MSIYHNFNELVGHTPILELQNTKAKEHLKANIFAKLEYYNPAGSIKDRVAKQMIMDAIENGQLKPGATIIEPTSGNTGIGICAVGTSLGYKVIIVMPETMSEERKKLMKAFGAELILTPGSEGMVLLLRLKNLHKLFPIVSLLVNLSIQVIPKHILFQQVQKSMNRWKEK